MLSAELTTPTPLSPAAQAVFHAFNSKFDWIEDGVPGPQFNSIAAALRALATRGEAVEIRTAPGMTDFDEVIRVSDVLAIAAELEGAR